ncbi:MULTISPECIES: DUF3693 domain-containing protein [Gammaproteobacteria]|uniref:DUF3693 domain-containing protein n=1 Tax=Gammaproteobacteria TaxID=1236 RepID=UPI003A8DDBF4
MYTRTLVDQYKKKNGITSDKEAAKELGVSASFLSKMVNGMEPTPDRFAIQLAESVGISASEAVIRIHAEQAKSDTEKRVWAEVVKRYSQRITATLAVLITPSIMAIHDYAYCILC